MYHSFLLGPFCPPGNRVLLMFFKADDGDFPYLWGGNEILIVSTQTHSPAKHDARKNNWFAHLHFLLRSRLMQGKKIRQIAADDDSRRGIQHTPYSWLMREETLEKELASSERHVWDTCVRYGFPQSDMSLNAAGLDFVRDQVNKKNAPCEHS